MKYSFLGLIAWLALAGCDSKSADGRFRTADKEIIREQIDEDTKTSIDSVAKTTAKGKILYPLPDTLLTLIEQRQPAAQVVTLPDEVMIENRMQIKNPLFLRGDFNGNKFRDYAVQLIKADTIHILAYLDYAGQVREMKVASYPARTINKQQYSIYQLKLAPKDSVVADYRDQRMRRLETDGISVVHEDRTTLYLLQKGRFIPFDTQ